MIGADPLKGIDPEVLKLIRQTLIDDECRFQNDYGTSVFSSLWSHSLRVALIAHHLAVKEGLDATTAVMAGLLHDAGKFAGGEYHSDETTEEEAAVEIAADLLQGTAYEKLLPEINAAILTLYRDGGETQGLGAVLYDADRLDKLGYMGISQFFSKNALRGRYLDNDLLMQASVELTYAHHAPYTLKTGAGKDLASIRSARVRSFFWGLLEEWEEMDLGAFSIREFELEGILLALVMPDACSCGGRLEVDFDLKDSVKCSSAQVTYTCSKCGQATKFSFCLPVLPDILAEEPTIQ